MRYVLVLPMRVGPHHAMRGLGGIVRRMDGLHRKRLERHDGAERERWMVTSFTRGIHLRRRRQLRGRRRGRVNGICRPATVTRLQGTGRGNISRRSISLWLRPAKLRVGTQDWASARSGAPIVNKGWCAAATYLCRRAVHVFSGVIFR